MSYYGKPNPFWPVPPQPGPTPDTCPQQPGTLLRISIPAGTVVNIANLLEVTSPTGICLLVRIPLLGGDMTLSNIIDSIEAMGCKVELMQQ